jgi:RimJ/RimL family protein N-acetyltransferase
LKSIQLLIELNFCCCLRKAGKLIAWLTTNEHFALGMLHVVETERGNGYAQLLVKYYCKTFLKIENLLPITFIADENEKSIKLFEKLNFSAIDGLAWIATEKED